jgi:hypothetical protein
MATLVLEEVLADARATSVRFKALIVEKRAQLAAAAAAGNAVLVAEAKAELVQLQHFSNMVDAAYDCLLCLKSDDH